MKLLCFQTFLTSLFSISSVDSLHHSYFRRIRTLRCDVFPFLARSKEQSVVLSFQVAALVSQSNCMGACAPCNRKKNWVCAGKSHTRLLLRFFSSLCCRLQNRRGQRASASPTRRSLSRRAWDWWWSVSCVRETYPLAESSFYGKLSRSRSR